MAEKKNTEAVKAVKSIKSGLSGVKNKLKEDIKEIKEEKAIAAEAEREVDEFAANLEKEMAAKKAKDLMDEIRAMRGDDEAEGGQLNEIGVPEKYVPAKFITQIIDPNNKEKIELVDDNGDIVYFDQVAVLPWKEKLFVILKPEDGAIEGVADDEAFAFSVEYDYTTYSDYLERVVDETDIEILFQMYYDLLDEQGVTE